jgi:hypothetical protein
MGPTAHWALDLRPDWGRPTLIGWLAPVTLRGIKRGGGHRLALQGSPLLTVQNRAQVHRKPTGDLVPFSPRRVLPRFVNPRIGSKLQGFSI